MTHVTDEYKGSTVTVDFTGAGQLIDSAVVDEWIGVSVEVSNPAGYTKGDFDIELGSVAFGANDSFELYIIPKRNDGAYPAFVTAVATAEQENNQWFAGSATTTDATEAQVLTIEDVKLPPGPFKVGARNGSAAGNPTLAASGNSVKLRYKAPTAT